MLYDLGKAVWDSLPADENVQALTLNEKIRRIAHRVRSLDESSRKAQQRISSFPSLPSTGTSRGRTHHDRPRSGGDQPLSL